MPEFGALFWKELYQFSNRRRFIIENVLFIALAAWVYLQASSGLYNFARGGPGPDYVAMSRFGRDLILGGTASVGMVFSVAALLLGAESLSREVTRGTLLFLVLIPGDPVVVLAAKLAAVVARVLLCFVLLVPMIAIASSFGGFDWPMVAVAALLALVNVVLYACVGLAAATARKSRPDSLGRAVGLAVLLNWAFGLMAIASQRGRFPVSSFTFISCTAIGPVQFASRGIIRLNAVALPAVILLFVSALLFLAARGLFAKNMLFLVSPLSARDKLTARPRRRRWFVLPRISQLARRYIEPGMTLRELSAWGFEWLILLPIACAPLAIIGLFAVALPEFGRFMTEKTPQMFLFAFAFNVIAVTLVAQASRRIAAEREAKTLHILGITALGPWGILIGKAAAVLLTQTPVLVILFLHAIWLAIIGAVPVLLFIPFVISVALALMTAPAIGLYFSLAAKKSAFAAIFAVYVAISYFTALSLPFDKSAYPDGDFEVYILWILFAVATLLTAFGFALLARRWRLGLIAHTLAFASLSTHVFLVKFALSPHVSSSEEHFYLFKEASFGLPLVIAMVRLLLVVLAWLAWIMISTFDVHVRDAA